MRCIKYNFVLIDVEVGILLTFLASMKAKVHVYVCIKSMHLFFGFLHMKVCVFHVSVSKYPLKLLDTKVIRFAGNLHRIWSDTCKWTPYPVRNCAIFRCSVNIASMYIKPYWIRCAHWLCIYLNWIWPRLIPIYLQRYFQSNDCESHNCVLHVRTESGMACYSHVRWLSTLNALLQAT